MLLPAETNGARRGSRRGCIGTALSFGVLCALPSVALAGPPASPSATASSAPAASSESPAAAPAPVACKPEVWQLGVDRYRIRDVTGAIAIWEKHVEVCGESGTWKDLYNLGLAYAEAGDATRAALRLDSFLRNLPQDAISQTGVAERFEDARKRLETLRSTHVTLRVSPAPDRVVLVRLGQGEPRPAGFEELLEPGEHRVVVDEGTARAKTSIVNAKAGEVRVIDIPALPKTPPPPPPRPPNLLPFVGVVGGLTAASFALPIGLIVKERKANQEVAAEAGRADYAAKREAQVGAQTRAYASFALPAGLAVVTGTLVAAHLALNGKKVPPPVVVGFDPVLRMVIVGGELR